MTPINDTGETITDEDGLCPASLVLGKLLVLRKRFTKRKEM
jgi:hypothetical protein